MWNWWGKMRSELEALKKYIFNGGKISYNCDESSVCSFVELLKPEYFYLFDAPDMFVKKDDYVLITKTSHTEKVC